MLSSSRTASMLDLKWIAWNGMACGVECTNDLWTQSARLTMASVDVCAQDTLYNVGKQEDVKMVCKS